MKKYLAKLSGVKYIVNMMKTIKQQIKEEFSWVDRIPDVVKDVVEQEKIRVVAASKNVGEYPNFLTRVAHRKIKRIGYREVAVIAAALGKSREDLECLAKSMEE